MLYARNKGADQTTWLFSLQNIKKLLKMPFEKSHMSMMVHRIGKSLLLDEFDIHKHLFRQEQVNFHSSILVTIMSLSFWTYRPGQTVQTQ